MRGIVVIAIAGACLGGCSSFSLDAFQSAPAVLQVQLESVPPGADAHTSLGPGCKTPCSVSLTPPDAGFSVTYSMNNFVPATVPVQVVRIPGDFLTPSSTKLDRNPVVAELQPVGPPPKPAGKKIVRPKRPKPPKTSAAAAPSARSPFPDPAQAPPPANPSPPSR